MMIHTATPVDETPFCGLGEFGSYDVTADWTDEDWAEHDRFVAAEIEAWDEAHVDDWWPSPEDFAAPM